MHHLHIALHVLRQDMLVEGADEVVLQQLVVIDRPPRPQTRCRTLALASNVSPCCPDDPLLLLGGDWRYRARIVPCYQMQVVSE